MDYYSLIAEEFKLQFSQVANSCEFLKNGATVPFLARYRKEATDSLDEVQLRAIQDKMEYFDILDQRKTTIIRRIESQNKLTPELRKQIEEASDRAYLEDIYLPFKPKKQTRASIAREAGLEPLAKLLESQHYDNSEEIAAPFINPEKDVKSAFDAVNKALDILAEELSENPDLKVHIRRRESSKALVVSEVNAKFKGKTSKYEMYYEFKEKLKDLPSHRILALRRGEKEKILKTTIHMDDEYNIAYLKKTKTPENGELKVEIGRMVEDAYKRLIKPAVTTEIRHQLKIKADNEAIEVFSKNLKDIIMAPPARGRVIMGVDPGFKSGTKLAVVDATGKFLEQRTIYPLPPQKEEDASKTILLAMIEQFNVEIVAIGNGTASREVDEFIVKSIGELESPPIKMIVSEAGASVYSASPVARQEFSDLDVSIRGAISIARRVQDPLAELVKIEPKSIGVGQYQHDVNQDELKSRLEKVVESSVNAVGVDVNTASESLLAYVSGINKALSKSIIYYREKKGPFKLRSSLVKVPKFGPKSFEQSAGFLRIFNGDNPLDGTGIHPERYELVEAICKKEGLELSDIINHADITGKIKFEENVSKDVGLPTLLDIKLELEKPNRDPRKQFVYAKFNPDIKTMADLVEGAWIEGVVSNVTDFGLFVDVGVHQDGLVHVSEFSNKYISDVKQHVAAGDVVKVRVLSVDIEKKRISLSMIEASAGHQTKRLPKSSRPGKKHHATVTQLKAKFNEGKKNVKANVKLKFSLKSIMRSGR